MNEPRQSVRKRADRRVVRTREALGGALVELMRARRFDDITVQQVLDRAGVGRATFYSHFRNKHDLLLSDAERFFDALERHFLANEQGRRVAPVAELFGHVAEYEALLRALDQSGPREAVGDLLVGHLARIIERRMAALCPAAAPAALPPAATARVFAGALVEMMRWWLNRGANPAPREMDAHFHEVVWGGLERIRP